MLNIGRIARIPGSSLFAGATLACVVGLTFSTACAAQDDSGRPLRVAVLDPPAFNIDVAALDPVERDRVLRSLEFYRHGDCKNAEPLFEQILLDQPKDIATRKLLGNCLLQDKKMDEARTQFQLVLDIAPLDVEASQGLKASMSEIQKQTLLKQSLAIQSRAVTAEEFQSSHEFTDAEKLIKAHRFSEAEKILDGIVSRHPDSVPARQRLAEIYSSTNRFDKAAEMYQTLSEAKKSSPEFLLRWAENLEWGRNYPKAAQAYRLYLVRKPNDPAALLALSRILMQGGNYTEAVKSYRLYLARKPGDNDARMVLANMLMWSGHYAEAVPEFERLQQSRPADLHVRLSLAQCYQQLAEKDKALKAYQDVLNLDPAHPAALKARREYLKYFDELPRQKAYAALERNDFDTAIPYFIQYSKTHPDDAQILLQIARVCSWAKRFPDAERYYGEYLQRMPHDTAVLRELAQTELWNKQYPEARKNYELLTRDPSAKAEDYESLLQTYTWNGDLAGAQPVAQKLIQIDPHNELARQTLQTFTEQKKLAARTQAEELAAARRYPEAIQAYRRYMDAYGKDPQIELLIARLYSWGKDYTASAKAFRDYLALHPKDEQARLELANVENWSGHYGPAETDYRAVLQQNPHDVDALVGVAQVMDYQQKDPFAIRDSYLNVLRTDPRNATAEKRLEEIHPLVAPALTYSQNAFSDSDGVFRTVNSLEMTFPFHRRVRFTPLYNFGYFHQDVAHIGLESFGNGAGGRIEVAGSNGMTLLGELSGVNWSESERVGTTLFQTNRTSLNARAEASFRPDRRGTLGLSYLHKDAVYDLTSVLTLAAGIMEDRLLISYQRPLSERVRFWTTGGFSHYTSGTLPSQFTNTQPQFAARLDYQPQSWITVGYSMRASGFTNASPIYFSPTLYQTHGLAYTFSKTVTKNLFVSADGEIDYGRIGTHRSAVPIGVSTSLTGTSVNTIELALVPRLKWRLPHRITLQLGYRFSQGRGGSALNLPGSLYRTEGAEFSLAKIF